MVKLYEGMTEGRGGNIPILPQIPLHSRWVGWEGGVGPTTQDNTIT